MGLDVSGYLIILATAVPTFFGVRWASRKLVKSNILLRQVLTWAGTIVLTLLLLAALVIVGIYYENYYPSRDFNEATWHADTEKRYEMTEDLIKCEVLSGKTKDEVQKILGNDFHEFIEEQWIYYIGARPGFHLESDILIIYFKDGRVERVEQQGT